MRAVKQAGGRPFGGDARVVVLRRRRWTDSELSETRGERGDDENAPDVVLRVQPARGVRPGRLGGSRTSGYEWTRPELWQDMAVALERAKFDLIMLGDSL